MNIDWIRSTCLALPHTTEHLQWGNDLVFKVGGKMFAVTALEPARVWLSFKASDENFACLVERPKVIPAPYLARAKWVALETCDALPPSELRALLEESHALVMARLPKSLIARLNSGRATSASQTRKIASRAKASGRSARTRRGRKFKPA